MGQTPWKPFLSKLKNHLKTFKMHQKVMKNMNFVHNLSTSSKKRKIEQAKVTCEIIFLWSYPHQKVENRYFWESFRQNQWKNWKFFVNQWVFWRFDTILRTFACLTQWNLEFPQKNISIGMLQPLVLFGATWVLYKRLFWSHFKSYFYEHLCIKKWKIFQASLK